jgi:uncharacterized protein (TIGR04255 family)
MDEKIYSLPDYENPPLTEVVCGVTFENLDNLIAPHLGLLWQQYQPDFPRVEEVPLLPSPIEIFEGQTLQGKLELIGVPPLPRELFISEDENTIIQIQRDRFAHNWRKLRHEVEYPRYHNVIESFEKRFSLFHSFIENAGMEISPLQYELTYVNQIPEGDLWEKVSDIGNIFNKTNFSFGEGLTLKEPETVNWRISFVLPEQSGRLYATVKTGATRASDNKKVIIFDLTVRGIGQDKSLQNMKQWFDVAREWIVKGFTDLTTLEAQKLWRRTK